MKPIIDLKKLTKIVEDLELMGDAFGVIKKVLNSHLGTKIPVYKKRFEVFVNQEALDNLDLQRIIAQEWYAYFIAGCFYSYIVMDREAEGINLK